MYSSTSNTKLIKHSVEKTVKKEKDQRNTTFQTWHTQKYEEAGSILTHLSLESASSSIATLQQFYYGLLHMLLPFVGAGVSVTSGGIPQLPSTGQTDFHAFIHRWNCPIPDTCLQRAPTLLDPAKCAGQKCSFFHQQT